MWRNKKWIERAQKNCQSKGIQRRTFAEKEEKKVKNDGYHLHSSWIPENYALQIFVLNERKTQFTYVRAANLCLHTGKSFNFKINKML